MGNDPLLGSQSICVVWLWRLVQKHAHIPHTLGVEERESEWLDFCPNQEEGSFPRQVLGDAKLTRYALGDLG